MINEYIENFLNYLKVERNYSNYTETNYLIDLEDYENYIKMHNQNYKSLNYQDISKYTKYLKEEKELNAVSINRHLSTIRSFYNYLVREGIIETNPFKLVRGPKKEIKLPNYMKYNEFEQMVEVCDETPLGIRNKAILEILLATGARIGEIVNIKLSDIDFDNFEIKVLGKGNKERLCYFNQHCHDALINYTNNSRGILLKNKTSEYLFLNHLGGHLTCRGVREIIDNILKKAAINSKVTPHTFRHTFATMLLNSGCDLTSVQELLGHVNLSTTSIYTHITSDRIKDIYLHTHPRNKRKYQ